MTLSNRIEQAAEGSRELDWRTQRMERPSLGTPKYDPNADHSLIHYAKSRFGMLEIYESDNQFLTSLPRSLGTPAELFDSLNKAKAFCVGALKARGL